MFRPGIHEIIQVASGRMLSIQDAIMQATQMIFEEVGDVLVLDVGGESADVFTITMGTDKSRNSKLKLEPLAQRTIEKHHGQGWNKNIKIVPETPEEIIYSAELIAEAIRIALLRHLVKFFNNKETRDSSFKRRNLTGIRWIVGTGVALSQLPNGLEFMRENLKELTDEFPQEGVAMLLDRDGIMASLGVLTTTYRPGAWQLLRESFGVEN